MQIKSGDWVQCHGTGGIGFVKRVAKDGSWADVEWGNIKRWTKRMQTAVLVPTATIPIGGMVVTDMTREAELAKGEGE